MTKDAGDGASQMSVLFDLWLVNHLISGALDDVLTDASGLSAEDFGFYSLLHRFGPVTLTQVVRWTAMRPTTVSTLARRLQQRGDVEQRPNPADGRSRLLALTPAGQAAHARTADTFFAATRTLAAALGPDEPRQRAALQRLDAALRKVGGLDPRPYTVPTIPPEGAADRRGGGARPRLHRLRPIATEGKHRLCLRPRPPAPLTSPCSTPPGPRSPS
jgi:DNA-binding MarR family transcriptional regulator